MTMRQTYLGGEKLFVDYAGNTVPGSRRPVAAETGGEMDNAASARTWTAPGTVSEGRND